MGLLFLFVALAVSSPMFARNLFARNTASCFVCETIVTKARELHVTPANVEHVLDTKVCGKVFPWLKDQCEHVIDSHFDALIGAVVDASRSPQQVCQQVGVCKSSVQGLRPLTKLVKPTLMRKLVLPISKMVVKQTPLKKLVPAVAAPKAANGIGCTICTLIVGFAEDKLESNATIGQIETFLNTTVCGFLPSFLRPECAALVDEYAPQMAQKIFQKEPASTVCKQVHLCSSATLVASAKASGVIGCTICTAIVGYAEERLGSNATIAEIESFLNSTVCSILPSFLRPECDALVEEYAPEMAQKIFQKYPASVVCSDVGLCPKGNSTSFQAVYGSIAATIAKQTEVVLGLTKSFKKLVLPISKMVVKQTPLKKLVPAVAAPKAANAIGCTICTLIVGYAEDKLESNATISEIEQFLNSTVCGFLPSFLRPECDALVDEYLPSIAQRIFSGENATTVCTQIHLCSSSQKVVAPKPLLQKLVAPISKMNVLTSPLKKLVKPKANSILCIVCSLVVNAAEEEISNAATVEEIESFLTNDVCTVLPRLFRPECGALVSSALPGIVGGLISKHNATQICGDVHAC